MTLAPIWRSAASPTNPTSRAGSAAIGEPNPLFIFRTIERAVAECRVDRNEIMPRSESAHSNFRDVLDPLRAKQEG